MRVAALYDVHGNAPALEAVLAEVGRERIDKILYGGDILSGPMPHETLGLVLSRDADFIRGNAERLDSPAPSAEAEQDRHWLKGELGDERVAVAHRTCRSRRLSTTCSTSMPRRRTT